MKLTSSQKRYLRSQAHHLKPVLQSGSKGVSDAFIAEVGVALDQHELIKVKIAAGDRGERGAMIDQLAAATGAAVVQMIGHIVVLFRRNPDGPRIALPS